MGLRTPKSTIPSLCVKGGSIRGFSGWPRVIFFFFCAPFDRAMASCASFDRRFVHASRLREVAPFDSILLFSTVLSTRRCAWLLLPQVPTSQALCCFGCCAAFNVHCASRDHMPRPRLRLRLRRRLPLVRRLPAPPFLLIRRLLVPQRLPCPFRRRLPNWPTPTSPSTRP